MQNSLFCLTVLLSFLFLLAVSALGCRSIGRRRQRRFAVSECKTLIKKLCCDREGCEDPRTLYNMLVIRTHDYQISLKELGVSKEWLIQNAISCSRRYVALFRLQHKRLKSEYKAVLAQPNLLEFFDSRDQSLRDAFNCSRRRLNDLYEAHKRFSKSLHPTGNCRFFIAFIHSNSSLKESKLC